jgi:hypothetical protein
MTGPSVSSLELRRKWAWLSRQIRMGKGHTQPMFLVYIVDIGKEGRGNVQNVTNRLLGKRKPVYAHRSPVMFTTILTGFHRCSAITGRHRCNGSH